MENTSSNNKSVFFIRAKLKEDYFFDGIRKSGYEIETPFRGNVLVLRILREIWFRFHLPFAKLWFSKKLLNIKSKNIIVFDPLMTPKFLKWLSMNYADRNLIFIYENRADKTISPNDVPPEYRKFSYDGDDCQKWKMTFSPGSYQNIYRIELETESKYDVVYVGRDKGRAEKLFELKRSFEELGLSMYLHICADRKYIHKFRKYYKPILRYEEYLSVVKKSKAILNIMPEGQTSITLRDLECVFNSVKGITNNKGIKDWKYYDPSRYFILGVDPIENLPFFLDIPFKKVSENELDDMSFDTVIEQILVEVKKSPFIN